MKKLSRKNLRQFIKESLGDLNDPYNPDADPDLVMRDIQPRQHSFKRTVGRRVDPEAQRRSLVAAKAVLEVYGYSIDTGALDGSEYPYDLRDLLSDAILSIMSPGQ